MKYFKVPNKWIYPLPANPSPPISPAYTRHLIVLLVDDMHLASHNECLYAWYNKITPEHLNELYLIISYAKGSSYRPDNIPLTLNGTFAFIDTEYPSHKPDYSSIKPHLNAPMLAYWNKLIKQSGP